MKQEQEWVSTGEVARMIGVTRPIIRKLIVAGVLVWRRPRHRYQIELSSVEAYMASPQRTGGK